MHEQLETHVMSSRASGQSVSKLFSPLNDGSSFNCGSSHSLSRSLHRSPGNTIPIMTMGMDHKRSGCNCECEGSMSTNYQIYRPRVMEGAEIALEGSPFQTT